jgi:hypothetical protein
MVKAGQPKQVASARPPLNCYKMTTDHIPYRKRKDRSSWTVLGTLTALSLTCTNCLPNIATTLSPSRYCLPQQKKSRTPNGIRGGNAEDAELDAYIEGLIDEVTEADSTSLDESASAERIPAEASRGVEATLVNANKETSMESVDSGDDMKSCSKSSEDKSSDDDVVSTESAKNLDSLLKAVDSPSSEVENSMAGGTSESEQHHIYDMETDVEDACRLNRKDGISGLRNSNTVASSDDNERDTDNAWKADTEESKMPSKRIAKASKVKSAAVAGEPNGKANASLGSNVNKVLKAAIAAEPNGASKTNASLGSDVNKVFNTSARQSPQILPNPAYRLLLRQGRLGHMLIMTTVLLVEWIEMWVPTLAQFLKLIFNYVFPPELSGGRLRPRTSNGKSSRISVTSSRTGQSGKQKQALTRKADEAALRQLKKVGSVREIRYRHVSEDFMKRHRLGSFAAKEAGGSNKTLPDTETTINRSDSYDDTDWIVKALTEQKSATKPLATPTLTVDLGSTHQTTSVGIGIDFGLEFGSQVEKKGKSFAKASSTASNARRRKSTGPRASDREGGDGLLGRLRVAAGANSRMSRSLFGAYPGDAVPLQEAASAVGLTELAKRYGYEDWSDDAIDSDPANDSRPTKKQRRRRRKPAKKNDGHARRGVGQSSGVAFQSVTKNEHFPKRTMASQAHTRPSYLSQARSRNPLLSSEILPERRSGENARHFADSKLVRPATQRLKELYELRERDGWD